MKRSVKKIYAFLCTIAMLIMLVPSMAFAAETGEEKAAICINVPQDWQNPCVWAWDEAGNNAFAAWPGEECEALPDNDGWYYVWVPDWANHIIVNANEGNVQTSELITEGKDAWISVQDADHADISYDGQTKGDIPEYVDKFLIHAKVDTSWENPCLWAWSAPDGTNAFEAWPGKTMAENEDGWYTAKAPIWVNSIIINANEGQVQTEDLSIDPAEIWVTVEADGTVDFSYTDPDKEAIPNVTVHVVTPNDWENPCLWAWSAPDGTNVYATWPGDALEQNGEWLTKEIPGWVNSIIVNSNEGNIQTTDISIETQKDVWIVVNGPEDYTVSYEEPEISQEAETTETVNTQEQTTSVSTEAEESVEQSGTPIIQIVIVLIIVAVVVIIVIIMKKKKNLK